jgi:hypothetical protein
MIVLGTNKSIMRLKFLIILFLNFDLMIKVSTSWSILLDKFDLMNKLKFDLMIKNSISWKNWILISWNSTSWPWANNFYATKLFSVPVSTLINIWRFLMVLTIFLIPVVWRLLIGNFRFWIWVFSRFLFRTIFQLIYLPKFL